jgi:hypothetical protein
MKKLLLLLSIVSTLTFAEEVKEGKVTDKKVEEEKVVDMSDPTQVYSSVSLKTDFEGDFDGSVGVGVGKNLGKFETNKGAEEFKLYYAHMNKGKGFYAEMGFGENWQTYSAGGVMTLTVGKRTKIFPVAMIGVSNVLNDSDPMVTGGAYIRTNIGKGFGIGADLFYTLLMNDAGKPYDGNSIKVFGSYQYKSHLFKLGYSNEADLDTGEEGEVYLQYTIAF